MKLFCIFSYNRFCPCVASLCKYIFNFDHLSSDSQWDKSGYNRLAIITLRHIDKIFRCAATGESTSIPAFSKQEFLRIFCHEFCFWRCDRAETDTNEIPIVWDTIGSRMLHQNHFGKSLMIRLPSAGSVPVREDTALPSDSRRVLSLLGGDNFVMVMCWSLAHKRNVFQLLTAKIMLKFQIENRPLTNDTFSMERNSTILHVVNFEICDGCKFDHFFDTEEKAIDFVRNSMNTLKFSGKMISEKKTYSRDAKSKSFWNAVCGTAEKANLIFSWLYQPNGRSRPSMLLLDGYEPLLVQGLRVAIATRDHNTIMNSAAEMGVLTSDLVLYLSQLRTIWEGNRLTVAFKMDTDEIPSREDVTANVTLAESLSISRYKSNAMIKGK